MYKYTDRHRKPFPSKSSKRKTKNRFKFNKIYFIVITIVISLFFMGGIFNYFNSENKKFEKKYTEMQNLLDFVEKSSYISLEKEKVINKIKKVALFYNKDLKDKELKEISKIIDHMTYKYENLDLDLILAVITQESGWKYKAISPAGARGLMQIMPATGEFLAFEENIIKYSTDSLLTPILNIKLGCRYLNFLISSYKENTRTALVYYNAGEKWANVYNKTGQVVPEETQNYLPSIERLVNKFNVL